MVALATSFGHHRLCRPDGNLELGQSALPADRPSIAVRMPTAITFVRLESIDFTARLNAAFADTRDRDAFCVRFGHKLQLFSADCLSTGRQR